MVWAREYGFRVGRVTDPGDSIYVCGIDSPVYYYARRRCATRFILASMLTGQGEKAAGRRRLFLDDLLANRPRLILLVRGTPYIPELDQFIRRTGYVKIGEDTGRMGMEVLCDPSRPVERINWTGD